MTRANVRKHKSRRGRPVADPADPQVPIVGDRVRAALQVAGLTEQGVANLLWERSGVRVVQTAVHKIATGRQATTRRSIRDGLARACGGWPVTSEWLSGGE